MFFHPNIDTVGINQDSLIKFILSLLFNKLQSNVLPDLLKEKRFKNSLQYKELPEVYWL